MPPEALTCNPTFVEDVPVCVLDICAPYVVCVEVAFAPLDAILTSVCVLLAAKVDVELKLTPVFDDKLFHCHV